MMASNRPLSSSSPPFGLSPLPLGDRRPQNLAEFIQRADFERGGFRNITEEGLREEVEADGDVVVESKEIDMLDGKPGDDQDENKDKADPSGKLKPEEYQEAIVTVMEQTEVAKQSASLAFEFISLLLSREDPAQAGMSLSPVLRDLVGVGSLGVDKLVKSNTTEARLQDHKTVATGWKLSDIDRTVDSLLQSASRLQKEMATEARYWEQVLAVSDKGWTVTRLPNEPEILGVRYGFSEAAPNFRKTSLAPMRRRDDGNVDLDCDKTLGESQRLLVTLERDGAVVGRSTLPNSLLRDAPLEDRVLDARNTVFAQELWHELDREGRLFPGYGVTIEDGILSYTYNTTSRIVVQLQTLPQSLDEESTRSLPEDQRAEALSAALHQLLTFAHRVNSSKRSQSNPKTRKQTAQVQPYQLVRPLLAFTQHEGAVEDVAGFISDLTTVLQSAGIATAMFKLTEPPIDPSSVAANSSPSEALIRVLLRPHECQFEFNITPESKVRIRCRTVMRSFILTTYHIQPLPLASGAASPLQKLYPPSEISNNEGYNLPDLKYYLQQAVSRVLIDRTAELVIPNTTPGAPSAEGELESRWFKNYSSTTIQNADDEREDIHIDVVVPRTVIGKQHPELRVRGCWSAGSTGSAQRTWTWAVGDAVQGHKQESLEQIVRQVIRGEAQPASD